MGQKKASTGVWRGVRCRALPRRLMPRRWSKVVLEFGDGVVDLVLEVADHRPLLCGESDALLAGLFDA
eukprot:509108-Prorocentrum_lima.AAC.1